MKSLFYQYLGKLMTQFIKNMSENMSNVFEDTAKIEIKEKFISDFSASQINFRIKLNALALNISTANISTE